MWRAVLLSWWLLGTLASSCPQHCRCFTDDDGYKVANCSKSGLVSGDLAPTIEVLNFKNQLRGSQTKLEARIFRNFRSVRYLNLQNSSIFHLPNDVFQGLSRVTKINLSFNKIKHLNGVVFKTLPNLRSLTLRGNFLSLSLLEVIVSETLQDLDMGLCSITNIPLYTFSSAPSLRHLTLDGNFIQTLEYNVLPKGLTYLNLANNNIVKAPIGVFNSLSHLVRLDISNNPINCSCSLLVFQDTLSGRAGILENDVVCANPPHLFGKKISAVNENQLCRDDYMTREGRNSIIYPRNRESRHYDHGYQSDEPLMRDESYNDRGPAEVMFTNDETNQMGTHMETHMSHSPAIYEAESTYDNKLLELMDETTPASEKVNSSPDVGEPPQDLTKPDPVTDLQSTVSEGNARPADESHSSDFEAMTEMDPTHAEGGVTKSELYETGDKILETEGVPEHSSMREDEGNSINTSYSSDPPGNAQYHPDTLNTLVPIHNSSEFDTSTTPTQDNHSEAENMLLTEMQSDSEVESTTPKELVELVSGISSSHETLSHQELILGEEATTEHSVTPENQAASPSVAEPSDYSYEAQHDDYGVTDNRTSEVLEDEPKLTDSIVLSSSTPITSDIGVDEGSGDGPENEETTETDQSSPTIGFMEEKETGTEPALLTVSDDLNEVSTVSESSIDVSSTTSSDGIINIATTDVSSTVEPSSEEPSATDESLIPTESTGSEEASSDIPTTQPTIEVSTETSTEVANVETSSETSSSSEPSPTPEAEKVTEMWTTESSTEISTEIPTTVEASSELASTPGSSSETPLIEISSESNPVTEASSSTPSSSEKVNFWYDSDEVETSPSSSIAPPTVDSSSSTTPYTKPKMIELTTESSKTKEDEVEVVTSIVGTVEKENIVEEPRRVEEVKNILTTGITFIIIGLLIALILILLTVIICRRKKTSQKVRLPVDPEAATGTELQDMLLPKPPENGIKVLPKNYTNGTTPLSNGKSKEAEKDKEESIPVLAPEPDPEPEIAWEDKPEPIETVTARLTMLARPQTPLLIQKSLN